jgi:hypothetical protein
MHGGLHGVEAVEKVGGILLECDNRTCAFDPHLESMLPRDPPKIFFDSIGHEQTSAESIVAKKGCARSPVWQEACVVAISPFAGKTPTQLCVEC